MREVLYRSTDCWIVVGCLACSESRPTSAGPARPKRARRAPISAMAPNPTPELPVPPPPGGGDGSGGFEVTINVVAKGMDVIRIPKPLDT